ncbi:hypothetical protein [Polluticoccus soli]|uniref:hypothetical protein n=1 Tax=Polluticoccus soli TaxID=3034150 RepID=UPI0023E27C81|nr:hypothetical protein [Flavipsychrobacter sp. JY13-12]
MQRYAAVSGDAGVVGYEILEDAVILEFRDGSQYLYSYARPGMEHVEQMKVLAAAGKGLTTYVNQHIREDYDKRLK